MMVNGEPEFVLISDWGLSTKYLLQFRGRYHPQYAVAYVLAVGLRSRVDRESERECLALCIHEYEKLRDLIMKRPLYRQILSQCTEHRAQCTMHLLKIPSRSWVL